MKKTAVLLFLGLVLFSGCGVEESPIPEYEENKIIKAEFTLIDDIDILKLRVYKAEIEVKDKSIVKILFDEQNVSPSSIEIIDKKGKIGKFIVDDKTIKRVGLRAIKENGEQVGDSVEVKLE